MDKLTRAAFLPSPGDPYCLLHAIHYFKTVWQDEVDKLYILINSTVEQPVINELLGLLKHPKIVVSYTDRTIGHGEAINRMLSQCNEDLVVLLEDDSIIFKKGIISTYFNMIEGGKYDLIGSPRMSCPKEVADKAKEEFGLNYEGFGDKGPNFWPCFFFTKRDILRETDRNFGATKYGDTLVNTSLQLRRLIPKHRMVEIPQYHLSPDDEQYKERDLSIFDGRCGYMHFGSLSSGIENTLLDDKNKPLKDRLNPSAVPVKTRVPQSIQEHIELERRVMWWNECYQLNIEKFGEFGELYGKAIEKVIVRDGLSRERINNMYKMYMEVINDRK